jgi:anti-sigma-K factor RskA
MNHEEWLERAEVYVLGALDADELKEFEAHLAAGCAECERRLRACREALAQLPRSLSPLEPPARIKAELLRRVSAETTTTGAERFGLSRVSWGFGAGALAAAALIIVLSWNLIATRNELQEAQNQLAALKSQVAQREEVVQFLSDPEVRIINLLGQAPSRSAKGQLLWNPVTRKGMLLTTALPQTPSEKAYELWGIAGAEAVPAGVFTVNERGQVVFRLPPLPESKPFDKFAVTLEPAGGVPQPTGAMVLAGNL